MFLGGWFWMAVDGFGCLQIVLGGFRWYSEIFSLVAAMKFLALNLKEVDNSGKIL